MTRKRKASDRRSAQKIHGESPKSKRDDAELRSQIMRSVRQERTGPEDAVAAAIVRAGIRFRRNGRSLPGSPDLANKTRRFAIFVHGCFWHRHPGCPKATTPKTNIEFWLNKFLANLERDSRKEESLRAIGYNVQVIWECETQDADSLDRLVSRLLG
jgi:DNA mismatch endonuclease (patch repair protein)